ncbi:iron ABC transporter [Paenibacillus selenitireducens]|uniref:Iron ABC transporter n=1 Tax=Paenibacillus selenitireducens TaxID=1324314 RepID=A0A1T2XL54_9BACL|nr:iron ABC transporter permease [Paenibacillus selenitireducens]OPA80456.1 iron ABC transporter [Paenibacillus selenitireducens]
MLSLLNTPLKKTIVLIVGILLLALSMLASVLFGLNQFSLAMLTDAYQHFQGTNEQLIIRDTRVPRALIGAIVGGSLAISGALMQALTKNPLASPSLFGINAGAVLFIAIAISLFGAQVSFVQLIWIAFLGAAVTSAIVYIMGSAGGDGMNPLKITISGAAVAAFASSVTSGIMLVDGKSLEQLLYWLVGSVQGRSIDHFLMILPYAAIGWIVSMFIGGSVNILAMGDEVATGLGQRIGWIKAVIAILIVILAGSAVAIAGPISFVCIIIPHTVRYVVGNNYKWILPYCAVYGGILLILADIVSRFVLMPKEVPVGVATALIGVPFFIFIARRRKYE